MTALLCSMSRVAIESSRCPSLAPRDCVEEMWRGAVATVDEFDVVEVVAEQLFKSCRGVLHGVDAGGEVGEQLGAGLVELLGEIVLKGRS